MYNLANRTVTQFCGDFYCPCQDENRAATVCVCEEVRNGGYVEMMGKCHCNLIVKPVKP
ncbi:MAG: hypothetical protein M1358_17150 [Chloroflexi bacterium]|nr:hypothetical protein [Chloroflexota bacterium]